MNEPLVYLEWVDSQGCTPSWQHISDYTPELPIHKSIGWIIHEDTKSVSITGNIADETETSYYQANGIMTIPKVAITDRRELKLEEITI